MSPESKAVIAQVEQWLAANDRYLSAELASLTNRLEQLAIAAERAAQGPPPPAAPPIKPAEVQRSFMSRLFKSDAARAPAAAPRLLPAAEPVSDTAAQPEKPIEAPDTQVPPALVLLAQRLGLSEFERNTLLLCAAMELDTRIGALCARAQQNPNRPFPTFALALVLFDQPAWDVLSPERPLRHWRLIEISQPGAQPLITSALKADERIVNYIKGLNYLDDRLTPLVVPLVTAGTELPPSQAALAETMLGYLERARTGRQVPVMQLLGADSQSKRNIAEQVAAGLGLSVYSTSVDALPTSAADPETFVRLWHRERALRPSALYREARDSDHSANSSSAAALRRLLSRNVGVAFLDTREPWPDLGREAVSIDVNKPTPGEQTAAWKQALGDAAGDHPAALAGQFSFNVTTIADIAARARATAEGQEEMRAALWSESLAHARPALDQLAQAIEPKATWEQLELPTADKDLLRQIAAQVKHRAAVYDGWGFRERMNRGFGISVLFAGESGTGKTMAAEVIANDLKLLLYRIDLSAVVSKYIGETEKNLRRLFDAAEDGAAILFFDEADALFGKRSEVKDSHDRYANIEVNYLLQRMEAYRGLAILATNMKGALDTAFLRRLRFIVDFPFPGPAERTAIWQKVFPSREHLAGLDYARLSRFNLTGGNIHNIALNAAFLAAQRNAPVGMPLLLEAIRTEYRKIGKPVNEGDFRWLEPAGRNA